MNLLKSLCVGTAFTSLILVDFALGNGFVDMFSFLFCKIVCSLRRTLKTYDLSSDTSSSDIEKPVTLTKFALEVLFLLLSMAFLSKYKNMRSMDRIDKLLQESREAMRQTNEFLEKWNVRRLQPPSQSSYFDDDQDLPQELEVPLLQMAIVDNRSLKNDRRDAGDSANMSDTAIISVTSFLEDELESLPDINAVSKEDILKLQDNIIKDINGRFLWDVIEEDNDVIT